MNQPPLPVCNGLLMTPGRVHWLRRLAQAPGSQRIQGRIGYDCMRAGLTQWMVEIAATGERLPANDARQRYPEGEWREHLRFLPNGGECLTDDGRVALEMIGPGIDLNTGRDIIERLEDETARPRFSGWN